MANQMSVQLRAAAARSDFAGAQVLLQAAKAWDRLLATGKHTSPRTAPALARLRDAAFAGSPAQSGRRSFVFKHQGHRYRFKRFPNGATGIFSMGGLDLIFALRPEPKSSAGQAEAAADSQPAPSTSASLHT